MCLGFLCVRWKVQLGQYIEGLGLKSHVFHYIFLNESAPASFISPRQTQNNKVHCVQIPPECLFHFDQLKTFFSRSFHKNKVSLAMS